MKCFLILIVFLAGVTAMAQSGTSLSGTSDETVLKELNAKYVESFMKSDVEWYREHLSDDFVCVESSGKVLDKTEFLKSAAEKPTVLEYHLEKVRIRLFGDTALVHGDGAYTRPDHTQGSSRYTDVYVKMNGEWKAVSAQITRVQ